MKSGFQITKIKQKTIELTAYLSTKPSQQYSNWLLNYQKETIDKNKHLTSKCLNEKEPYLSACYKIISFAADVNQRIAWFDKQTNIISQKMLKLHSTGTQKQLEVLKKHEKNTNTYKLHIDQMSNICKKNATFGRDNNRPFLTRFY